jgi:hypothetical protein
VAANCYQGIALFVDERDTACLEIEVQSNQPRVEKASVPAPLERGPLRFVEIAKYLHLAADESVRRILHYSRPSYDPTVDELLRLRKNAMRFNTRALRYLLPRDEDRLRDDINLAMERRLRDTEALKELVFNTTLARVERVDRHLLWIYSGREEWKLGGARMYFATDLAVPADQLSVEVRFEEPPDFDWAEPERWASLLARYGVDESQSEHVRQHGGDASHIVGPLLGYAPDNVQFWPEAYSEFFE